METIKAKLYIHSSELLGIFVSTNDMSYLGHALLGVKHVEVEIPDCNIIDAEIKALHEQANSIEGEALNKAKELRNRARDLKVAKNG